MPKKTIKRREEKIEKNRDNVEMAAKSGDSDKSFLDRVGDTQKLEEDITMALENYRNYLISQLKPYIDSERARAERTYVCESYRTKVNSLVKRAIGESYRQVYEGHPLFQLSVRDAVNEYFLPRRLIETLESKDIKKIGEAAQFSPHELSVGCTATALSHLNLLLKTGGLKLREEFIAYDARSIIEKSEEK